VSVDVPATIYCIRDSSLADMHTGKMHVASSAGSFSSLSFFLSFAYIAVYYIRPSFALSRVVVWTGFIVFSVNGVVLCDLHLRFQEGCRIRCYHRCIRLSDKASTEFARPTTAIPVLT